MVNATISDVGGDSSAYYTPTASGVYRLDVTLGGRPVGDSPYRLSVFPAPTSPAHCAASGAGLLEAIAGESGGFVIVPRDSFGNARPPSVPIASEWPSRGAARRRGLALRNGDLLLLGWAKWQPAVVTDLQNGTYGKYVVKRAGFLIEVKLGGIHVMGSPSKSPCSPQDVSSSVDRRAPGCTRASRVRPAPSKSSHATTSVTFAPFAATTSRSPYPAPRPSRAARTCTAL